MTDRYTELVKQAYEAQMAREGPAYVALTGELTAIDANLEALSAKRETTISALESMDEAVEAAKEALDAYFAGREEYDHPLTRAHMHEHDEDELGPKASYDPALFEPVRYPFHDYTLRTAAIEPLSNEEDECATAKANGAYTDRAFEDFTPPARAD